MRPDEPNTGVGTRVSVRCVFGRPPPPRVFDAERSGEYDRRTADGGCEHRVLCSRRLQQRQLLFMSTVLRPHGLRFAIQLALSLGRFARK